MYICVFTSTGTIELIVYPGFYESNYGPDGNARHCRSGQNPTSPMSPGWVGVHRPVVLHIQDLLILFCGEPTCLYSVQCTLTIFIVRFLSPKFYSPLKPYLIIPGSCQPTLKYCFKEDHFFHHLAKNKANDIRSSENVLIYKGRNVIWLMTPTVHMKMNTKTKTKCLKDLTFATVFRAQGLKGSRVTGFKG